MSDFATVLELMYHAAEIDDEWGAAYNVKLMLDTREGQALAALVEAALAVQGIHDEHRSMVEQSEAEMRMFAAARAYREATLMAATMVLPPVPSTPKRAAYGKNGDIATVLARLTDSTWAEYILDKPEGKALAALVEAALAWRGQWVPDVPDGASTPEDMRLLRAIDAALGEDDD